MLSTRLNFLAALIGAGLLHFAGTAHAQNLAPSITGTPPTVAATGQTYTFVPVASDSNGDTLYFGVGGLPRWASFDKRTGRLYGRPGSRDLGTSRVISIAVSDGKLTANLPSFTITVRAGGSPWISGVPATTATENVAYSFVPTAGDPEGDRVTFLIANKPSWASFSRSTGQLTGMPPAGSAGTYSGIRISVSDGATATSLPTFSIAVTASAARVNAPPTLSGQPAVAVTVGATYSFQPSASDPEGAALTFSVANKPGWAIFDSLTGRLQGTPTAADVGTYSNVTIRVSDGTNTTALPAFAISVKDAVANGAATLAWQPPTENVDGTPLLNLSGFRVRYGKSVDTLDQVLEIPNPGITSAMVESLSAGTWFFAVKAYTAANVESNLSNVVQKLIP